MSNEFLLEVFFIKIKVQGYLKNLTENTEIQIDTNGIKNKDTITYINEKTKYKLNLSNKDKILLLRDNEEFLHSMIFELNKEHSTEYFIKELNSSLYFKILTTSIELTPNKVKINYKTIDNDNEYLYVIEMSEK